MGLFNHNKDNANTTAATGNTDPTYNNEMGGQQGVYQDQGMGMGVGPGHQNNATMGMSQGNAVPADYNSGYGTNAGTTTTGTHHGLFKHGAEGAALGGVAGHEGAHGHTGRDAAIGATGGAALAHHHNHHHNNAAVPSDNYNTGAGTGTGVGAGTGAGYGSGAGMGTTGYDNNMGSTTGTGTGMGSTGTGMGNGAGMGTGAGMGAGTGMGSGVSNNQGTLPDVRDAKHLERSGKMDKFIGTITGSTSMKQEGMQKQAEAAAIRAQTTHLTHAQQLEAQAQMARGHAVGLGAHPSNATAGGVQPSNGPGTGPVVGGGVGGGGGRVL